VGERGSGKTTIARLITTIYPATSGTILFEGRDVTKRQGHRGKLHYRSGVQMISQDPFASLNPVKRIEYDIRRPLRIHNIIPRSQVWQRVRSLLETVGLVPPDEVARKFPHQLSGGQRQRVSIAPALAVEPKVILADEPTSMLDVSIRMGVLNLLLDLKRERNIAVLFITHDIASAHYVADDLMVMYAGQIVESGTADQVLLNPLHPYTRLLLSAIPNPERAGRDERFGVPGEARGVIDPPNIGRFAPRCPVAIAASRCSTPDLVAVEPGHYVRCHLYSNGQGVAQMWMQEEEDNARIDNGSPSGSRAEPNKTR
jgi:peptide/nickel transport system ATP-binding protein